MAIAEVLVFAARRQFHQWKNSNLRPPVGLLDETEFCAQLHVTPPVMSGSCGWRVVCQGRNYVKLQVRDGSVIDFKMRRGSRPIATKLGMHRSDIKLPVLVIHRLRIVGHERRTGEGTLHHPEAEDSRQTYGSQATI